MLLESIWESVTLHCVDYSNYLKFTHGAGQWSFGDDFA